MNLNDLKETWETRNERTRVETLGNPCSGMVSETHIRTQINLSLATRGMKSLVAKLG